MLRVQGEKDMAALKDMAAQLAAMLREKGRDEWTQLQGKLAEVTTAISGDDPTTAIDVLLKIAKDWYLMRAFEERVSKASPALLKEFVLLVADELSMTPLCDSEPVEIVDRNGKFYKERVDHVINSSAELSAPNAPYAVVSIVGPRCSGKSYLMNQLFGTKFHVMDASRGWSRTRQGVFLSRCIGPSLLLLDVEGFTLREKAELEMRETNFLVSISDVVMVNMSVFDIGRDDGVAREVIRTIFKRREKYQSGGFPKILVVLRFYDGETPLEIVRNYALKSFDKIWESMDKEHVKFRDCVEVNIVVLPYKSSPEFTKEVALLRNLLSNNRSAIVPACSFSLSSSVIWDTIMKNKELDIPFHQVAVARLYCRRLVEDTLKSLNSQEEYKLLESEKSLGRFKVILLELIGKIMTGYDVQTKMYDPDVRDKERRYLVEKLSMFYQDNTSVSIIPSNSSITSRHSSGHAEASSSTHSNKYLSATEPIDMTYQELQRMTDGFSEKLLLGKGGFGMVYKGVDNGKVIAVKKLYSQLGLDDSQFRNELLNLMRVQHQNIMRLVGYCSETRDRVVEHEGKLVVAVVQERALCLEYMQGGTLEERISDESCGLDWEARYKIIKGMCQGLKYLHTRFKDPIYHMDLKPTNILLDKDMTPKIGDFGLSRLLDSAKTFVTQGNPGTLGYMPPEYIVGKEVSQKFDVFSLGVIMMEVMAGKKAYNKYKDDFIPSQECIDHVSENWSKRVQEKPMSAEALLEVEKCMRMALRCVEDNRANRPTITEIVEELNMIDLHPTDAGDETTPAALSIQVQE